MIPLPDHWDSDIQGMSDPRTGTGESPGSVGSGWECLIRNREGFGNLRGAAGEKSRERDANPGLQDILELFQGLGMQCWNPLAFFLVDEAGNLGICQLGKTGDNQQENPTWKKGGFPMGKSRWFGCAFPQDGSWEGSQEGGEWIPERIPGKILERTGMDPETILKMMGMDPGKDGDGSQEKQGWITGKTRDGSQGKTGVDCGMDPEKDPKKDPGKNRDGSWEGQG